MEMLIVVALFSTMAVILSQLFVSFNRLHRKVSNAALLGEDMRFATESLIRLARNHRIDYTQSPLAAHATEMRFLASDGTSVRVAARPGNTDCQDPTVSQCLALSLDGGVSWQPITARRVEVTNFDVYVRPLNSPFIPSDGGYDNNLQPFVTFNIGLRYIGDTPTDGANLQAQTTVSSRVYLR